jgi:ABC-2 type transport system ATP-binding protein
VELVVRDPSSLPAAASALSHVTGGEPDTDTGARRVTAPVTGGAGVLVEVLRAVDDASITIDDIALRRPTLDDVFLALTGHAAEEDDSAAAAGKKKRGRR